MVIIAIVVIRVTTAFLVKVEILIVIIVRNSNDRNNSNNSNHSNKSNHSKKSNNSTYSNNRNRGANNNDVARDV